MEVNTESKTIRYKRYFRDIDNAPRGVVLAEPQDDGSVIVAVSKCHPKDALDKKRGTMIAEARLHDEHSKARFVVHLESWNIDILNFLKTRRRFEPMEWELEQVSCKALGLCNY